jgi:hypothetical protein
MDRKQKYLLSLYGESTPPEHPDGSRFEDPDGEALREMKQLLDERPRMSPPDHLVRDVLAMARYDAAGSTTRRDRAPVARKRRAPVYAAAFSSMLVLIAVGLFVFLSPVVNETGTTDISVADVIPAPSHTPFPAEPVGEPARTASEHDEPRSVPSPAQRPVDRTPRYDNSTPVQLASTRPATPPIDEQLLDLLSWDDTREFQQVHHMIDVVQSRGRDIEWDEPAVPLELLPEARPSSRSGVRQVGWRDIP